MTADDDVTAEVEALAREDTALADQAALIAERREQIRARLLALHPGSGTLAAGPYKVTVRAGARRLDTARIAADFPVATRPELYEAKVSTTAVRAHIAEVDLDPYLLTGRPTVVIQ